MNLTPAARALAAAVLIAMEGLRLAAYKDGGGVWTIGVGSTHLASGRPVRAGDVISRSEAMDLLDVQINEWTVAIGKAITVTLSDAWAAILVSFVHQEGTGALPGSVLADMLNTKMWDRAAAQLNGWVIARVNGVRQPVLGIERRMEAQRQIALGAPLEPTRTRVWQMGDETLRPLYTVACADALDYRHGVATWEAVPAAVPTHPSTATAQRLVEPITRSVAQTSPEQSTDDLNDAQLASIRGE